MEIKIPEDGYARGRLYTRSPSTGANRASAEVFFKPGSEHTQSALPLLSLQKALPQASRLLEEQGAVWQRELRDAIQVDFEIEGGQLRMGTPAPMRRSPKASVAIAVELAREGLLSTEEALGRVGAEELASLLLSSLAEPEVRKAQRQGRLLAEGSHGWGGAAHGVVAFDTATAWRYSNAEKPVILVCEQLTCSQREALPALNGLVVAGEPILAATQFELPCLVVPDLKVRDGVATFPGGKSLVPGDKVSLDGGIARLFAGEVRLDSGRLSEAAVTLLGWAEKVEAIEIRANVSSGDEVEQAIDYGARGVGLCRMESLLLLPQILTRFQFAAKEICTGGSETDPAATDFAQALEEQSRHLFHACRGFRRGPITVRLFDAPLSQMVGHWLEHGGLEREYLTRPISDWLDELNPMQGLRGGRLSIIYPALMRLQVRALLRAWQYVAPEGTLRLQLMMPGVCDAGEVRILRQCVVDVAREEGVEPPEIGSMLELPRACLTADALAGVADFLSFGTGDLTESTCGLSRYDSQLSFLPGYLSAGIFDRDPFQAIDQAGVGALMRQASELVRGVRPEFELGTVGAQAIDAASLRFCCKLGLRFASVPARHVPVARLVAAQVALGAREPAALGSFPGSSTELPDERCSSDH